jgi:hypothetical protein
VRAAGAAAVALALATVCVFLPLRAHAGTGIHPDDENHALDCPDSAVRVLAPTRAQALIACEAAAQASRFLASHGLDVSRPFTLRIASGLPPGSDSGAVGCYDRNRQQAWVLIDTECRDTQAFFGLPMTPSLYRSLIVHEVAHGFAQANFRADPPGIVAHEYIAYVTQLASLPIELRQRILDKHPASTIESVGFLNSYVYLMDPGAFAAIAWRHHNSPEGGTAFMNAVLQGRALSDPW